MTKEHEAFIHYSFARSAVCAASFSLFPLIAADSWLNCARHIKTAGNSKRVEHFIYRRIHSCGSQACEYAGAQKHD